MKTITKTIVLLFVSLFFTFCGKEENIEGTWLLQQESSKAEITSKDNLKITVPASSLGLLPLGSITFYQDKTYSITEPNSASSDIDMSLFLEGTYVFSNDKLTLSSSGGISLMFDASRSDNTLTLKCKLPIELILLMLAEMEIEELPNGFDFSSIKEILIVMNFTRK